MNETLSFMHIQQNFKTCPKIDKKVSKSLVGLVVFLAAWGDFKLVLSVIIYHFSSCGVRGKFNRSVDSLGKFCTGRHFKA
jgi:hypothetical protein